MYFKIGLYNTMNLKTFPLELVMIFLLYIKDNLRVLTDKYLLVELVFYVLHVTASDGHDSKQIRCIG